MITEQTSKATGFSFPREQQQHPGGLVVGVQTVSFERYLFTAIGQLSFLGQRLDRGLRLGCAELTAVSLLCDEMEMGTTLPEEPFSPVNGQNLLALTSLELGGSFLFPVGYHNPYDT